MTDTDALTDKLPPDFKDDPSIDPYPHYEQLRGRCPVAQLDQRCGMRPFVVTRYEEAKAALADPSQAEVPVITIAMDAGFQSLGPFNRAFKATTGVTPSEYRRLNAPAA